MMGLGRFIQKALGASGARAPVSAAAQGVVQRAIQSAPVQSIANRAPSAVMPPAKAISQAMQGIRGMRFKKGGSVSSGRGEGIAVRGKTKCKMY